MSEALAYAIDFGTSNSSIAIVYPDRTELVAVESNSVLPESLPSIIYLDRTGQRTAGRDAVQQFLVAGAQRTTCGRCELVDRSDDGVYTDCRTYKPGGFCMDSRLMSGLKSFFSERNVRTHSWATDFTLPTLASIIIRSLKARADAQTGGGVSRVMLGHPVAFEGTEGPGFEGRQKIAIETLTRAAELAGFDEIGLFPEPSAAVINESLPSGTVVALDFGGGTFDVAVIELEGDGGEVTALQGAAVGGERFDAKLFDLKVAPALGLNNSYQIDGRSRRLPGWFRSGMRTLSGMAGLLSSPDAGPTLRGFVSLDGGQLRMVDRILYEGHAYSLHKAIEEAKITLSTEGSTQIRLQKPGIELNLPVSQQEFSELVAPDIDLLRKCIERALEQAGKTPQQVDLVIRTGGSSRISAFIRMLESLFGPRAHRGKKSF